MNKDKLHEYILLHHTEFSKKDLEDFKVFFSTDVTPFGDASDDMLVTFMRYISPDNKNDWGYDIFVHYHTDEGSLVFWDIERVFSTHFDLTAKTSLVYGKS